MRVSLKNFIVPSIPLAVFLVVCCSSLWFISATTALTTQVPKNIIDVFFQVIFNSDSVFSKLVSLGFTLLNAFLIAQINNRFTIIRTRTFLPIFIFVFLMGIWSQTHRLYSSQLSLTLFIIALFYFFSMSRDRKASEEPFMGTLLISVSSMLINQLILLVPICWLGFVIFQSFSLRTFLASLFGLLAPWVVYLAFQYFIWGDLNFWNVFNIDFNFSTQFSSLSIPEIVYLVSVTLILMIALVGMFSVANSDAIHTRNKLNFLVLTLVSLSLFMLLFRSEYYLFLPYLALVYSILISHPFTLKQSNFYGILFVIFLVINIAFVISKFIIP